MRALVQALCFSDRRSQEPFTSESLALHVFTFHSSRSGIPPEYHRQYVICCPTLMYSAKQPPRNVLILACALCDRSLPSPQQTCSLMHVVDASAQALRAGRMCMTTYLCTYVQACKREVQCCSACFRQYQQGFIRLHTCPATKVFC